MTGSADCDVRLRFRPDGTFRVLQLADVQDGPDVSRRAIMLIEAAVKRADPDLVVLTGDQIRGYDPAFERTYVNRRGDAPGAPLPPGVRTEAKMARVGKCVRGLLHRHNTGAASDPVEEEDTETKVMRCLSGFLGPIVSRGIPFAVTYGNHDFQCGVPLERQDELYRAFDGCLNPVDSLEPGTFGLTIDAHDGRQTAMGVMMVNSGDFAADGGYGSPSDDAVAWLGDVVKDVGAPSVVFQHIPPPEIYDCLVPVGRFTTNAIRGYRAHSGTCYVLDQEHSKPGSALREHPCCSEHNSGEVRAMKNAGGYFALFCGHDHTNLFITHHDGLDMGYTPTCGFTSYGPRGKDHALRVFEFHESDPASYTTELLDYGDLLGWVPPRALQHTFGDRALCDAGCIGDMLRKPSVRAALGVMGAVGAAAFGVVWHRLQDRPQSFPISEGAPGGGH